MGTLNTPSQAASGSRWKEICGVYSTYQGWALHGFDPLGSWHNQKEATTNLPARRRRKGKGERPGPGLSLKAGSLGSPAVRTACRAQQTHR